MSATGRNVAGHEREPRNFYRTPSWTTRAIWNEVIAVHPDYRPEWGVIDAGCGDGAIMHEVMRMGHMGSVMGIELDAGLAEAAAGDLLCSVLHMDFLTCTGKTDLVIMNPPFPLAMQFAEHALRFVAPRVAMLMRVGFVETDDRIAFLRRCPCDIHVLPGRPKFAHGKTDSTIYAWLTWGFSPGWSWSVLQAPDRPRGRQPK